MNKITSNTMKVILFALLIVAMMLPFSAMGLAEATESSKDSIDRQRVYTPGGIEYVQNTLDGSADVTKTYKLETSTRDVGKTVEVRKTVTTTGDNTYVIKTTISIDGVRQYGQDNKYSVQVNNDGTYRVWNNNFDYTLTSTNDRSVTKSIDIQMNLNRSLTIDLLHCTQGVDVIGHGTSTAFLCGGNIQGTIRSSSSSANWYAPETRTFYWFIDTIFHRAYTIAGDFDSLSNCNDCSWTAGGTYSPFGTERIGGTFYYRII